MTSSPLSPIPTNHMMSLMSVLSVTSTEGGRFNSHLSYSEELALTFDLLDCDRDGYLSVQDVVTCLRKLSIPSIARHHIRTFLGCISNDPKGVSEEEFVYWLEEQESTIATPTKETVTKTRNHREAQDSGVSRSESELRSAFDIIDRERRGYITKNDVKRLMDNVDQPIASRTLENMFNLATGQKHKQRLTCKEFIQVLS